MYIHQHYLIAWRVFNAGLLTSGFVLPWTSGDAGWTAFLFSIYLPILLIADPLAAVFLISVWLAASYLVLNLIGIIDRFRTLGWVGVILLLGTIAGLLVLVLKAQSRPLGIGYHLVLFALVSSSYLETIGQVSE